MRIPRAREGSTTFGLVVGALIGVLIAALVPRTHTNRSAPTSSIGGGIGVGASGSGGTAPGAAGPVGSATAGGPAAAGSAGGGLAGGTLASGTPGGNATPGTAAAQGGAATGGVSGPTGAVPGVTSNTVTIGIAYLDLGAVAYLGPQYNIGNVPEQWKALLDGWHRQGLVPVNGRDVRFVFQSYNVLDTTQQNAACTTLVQDDHAFAVIAPQFFYQYGDLCVAAQNHTPLITSDGAPDSVYAAGAPNLFTTMTSADNSLQNWLYWAQRKGFLKGKRIGVYYLNDAEDQSLVNRDVKGTLSRLGYSLAAEATTDSMTGGPNDSLAVERFRAAGVNLALLMASNMGFQEQAMAQDYYPTYIDSDYNGDTTYLGANDYPPQEYNGTYAVTEQRHGESAAGMPAPPQDGPCLQNYERYSGQTIQPANETNGTWVYIMLSCDLGSVLLHALQGAGRSLTRPSLISAIESIKSAPMTTFPNLSFGPGDHEGVHDERTVQWHGDCRCWVAIGSFSPLLVQPAPSG